MRGLVHGFLYGTTLNPSVSPCVRPNCKVSIRPPCVLDSSLDFRVVGLGLVVLLK